MNFFDPDTLNPIDFFVGPDGSLYLLRRLNLMEYNLYLNWLSKASESDGEAAAFCIRQALKILLSSIVSGDIPYDDPTTFDLIEEKIKALNCLTMETLKQKENALNYLQSLMRDLFDRKVKMEKWAKDVFTHYFNFQKGLLPDNRGTLFNNPHLLEAFQALAEVESERISNTSAYHSKEESAKDLLERAKRLYEADLSG